MELREGQRVKADVSLTTRRGKAASYQKGSASWESDNPDVVSVAQDPENELSAWIEGVDGSENAATVVSFRCDADPSSDVKHEIIGTLDVVCTHGMAQVVSITTGAAEDIPGAQIPGEPVTAEDNALLGTSVQPPASLPTTSPSNPSVPMDTPVQVPTEAEGRMSVQDRINEGGLAATSPAPEPPK